MASGSHPPLSLVLLLSRAESQPDAREVGAGCSGPTAFSFFLVKRSRYVLC